MSDGFDLKRPERETLPLLVSVPHAGTAVPDAIAARFASDEVRALADTDWHVDRLYGFVPELGATLLVARYSRYVVDLNRPASGRSLYPGRDETGIVPTTTFRGAPIWRVGEAPDEEEQHARVERYWQPYHDCLRAELDRIRAAHGVALLFDAHSIASRVPRFFEGELPGLILGDADGTSCGHDRSARVLGALHASGHEVAHNQPFKGGWITRCYGRPKDGVHALQLEMAQRLYMDEAAQAWRDDRAGPLQATLHDVLQAFVG